MNCDEARDMILLEDSGELEADKAAALGAHVASCPDCGQYAKDLAEIRRLAHGAVRTGRPSRETIDAILAYRAPSPAEGFEEPLLPLRLPSVRLAAAAAAFLLVAGGVFLMRPTGAGRAHSRAGEVSDIIAMVTAPDFNAEAAAPAAESATQLKDLARQLLKMEGMWTEDEDAEAEAILFSEPQPTDLQSHSTSGFPRAGCV